MAMRTCYLLKFHSDIPTRAKILKSMENFFEGHQDQGPPRAWPQCPVCNSRPVLRLQPQQNTTTKETLDEIKARKPSNFHQNFSACDVSTPTSFGC